MNQGLHQVQKQTQSLVLAPQLRQSLKILQSPAIELRNVILEELQTNPTLEELPMEGVSIEAKKEAQDTSAEDQSAQIGSASEEMKLSDEDYSILNKLDEDFREYFAQEASTQHYSSDDEQRRQYFFDSLVSDVSLQEHLTRQADMVEMTEQERQAIDYLVGSLDDRGFLTNSLSELSLMSHLPLSVLESASTILKTFDPPGIGALNLQDSLLQQLKQRNLASSLAAQIVKDCFELLLRRRIPEITRKLGSRQETIEAALNTIAGLDPAPGRKFSEDTNRVIVPDVTIEKVQGEWSIQMNADYIPRLRLSKTYKDVIAKGILSSKDKEYIREKMRDGKFLISSIEQRQQTVERIAREILAYQNAFFESGISKLKPLTMNQIAQVIEVHETTISRAIANKYMETPHGVFEFKYFFTSGYQSLDGSTLSNKSVKDLIAKIIEDENPLKPLSDKGIVEILAEKDIEIARRTVAKYREEMGILPTNLRRKYTSI